MRKSSAKLAATSGSSKDKEDGLKPGQPAPAAVDSDQPGDETPQPSPYAVPALERGMQIVEMLADAKHPLSLTEIADRMSLSSGVVFRLLRQMHHQRWLMQDVGSQKYMLSLRLHSFALSANPNTLLLEAARLPLQDLARETGQSCHLSILLGHEVVVMASGEAPSPVRLTIDTGFRQSALDTTSGHLLIAMLPEEDRTRYECKLSADELNHIASVGFVVSHHRNVQGVHDLCVPIRLPQGYASLALTALYGSLSSSPKYYDEILGYLPVMRQTAALIEETLGLPPLTSEPHHEPPIS